MKKIIGVALLALCFFTAQAQQLVVISSPNLHTDDSVLVFIPAIYQSQYEPEYCVECCGEPAPLPALFLLHGWSGCYRDWSNKTNLQDVADESGFIIICPDGFYDSWYVNATDPMQMQWRDFFDQELYPQIMKKYYLSPEKTFITGLSMGGHGAINLFLDDINRFRGAGSMSGVLDLNAEKGRLGLNERLGTYGPENKRHDEESAIYRIERAQGTKKLMLISCGYSDTLYPCTSAFCDRCRELGVPYIEIDSPGVHSWKYWDYALRLHLWYFSRILYGENLGY
jgi:S-formylglutathione hydrolase FrmB